MTTLTLRIDPKLKKRVSAILQKSGLNMSRAVNMYFHDLSDGTVKPRITDRLSADERMIYEIGMAEYRAGKGIPFAAVKKKYNLK